MGATVSTGKLAAAFATASDTPKMELHFHWLHRNGHEMDFLVRIFLRERHAAKPFRPDHP